MFSTCRDLIVWQGRQLNKELALNFIDYNVFSLPLETLHQVPLPLSLNSSSTTWPSTHFAPATGHLTVP